VDLLIMGLVLAIVIWLYFQHNPLSHDRRFLFRRFVNWFPLGMSYAFMYMARYNLNVAKAGFGSAMSKEQFGYIFGFGTLVYGLSFLLNGPLVDRFGGKRGMVFGSLGSALCNVAMGVVTYMFMNKTLNSNLLWVLGALYALNMFFQSYGAVSIIKVKAYWFHVRERGVFGAIFGTLISVGIYFAFDWGQAIADAAKVDPQNAGKLHGTFNVLFGIDKSPVDAFWLIFFIPAFLLVFWALIDTLLIKDTPGEANFADFDTADASSGEMDKTFTVGDLLKRIFTSPILLTVAMIEFTGGVLRNGIYQWYFIFGKEVKQVGAEFFVDHWGLLLALSGIVGGFSGGWISDKVFQSRRGPAAAIMNFIMFGAVLTMALTLKSSPITVGVCCLVISMAVIGVHSLMSGTAAADFGGRKATATASGITDGFTYLGSAAQSMALGHLTGLDWIWWPIFLLPFTLLGLYLAIRMWHQLPEATKRYNENEKKRKEQLAATGAGLK
jgi:OPA family glycerol-3-phosphate transporter-like MFS transporter